MVRLSLDLIARGTSGYTKKKRDESIPHYIKRLTHLYLEDKNIDDVGDDLQLCRNLTVLYLYDNKINKVPELSQNHNLTHLYLQNNEITKLENLNFLKKLSKLYVGGNSITVVEGLDKLDTLQELHIENQRLPPGEKLLFEPRTLAALSCSLQILNVSGNNLESIRDLECIRGMTQFMANDNQLSDLKELAHCLSMWRNCWRLELAGNAFCHKAKYRDRVIIMSNSLEVLDGKDINDTARQFLKNWHANKEERKKRKEMMGRSRDGSLFPMGGSVENGHGRDLPPVIHRHNTIPGYVMPGLPRKQFDEVLAKSSAMHSMPTSAPPPGRINRKTYSDIGNPKPILRVSKLHPRPEYNSKNQRYLSRYGIYEERTASGSLRPAMINLGSSDGGDGLPSMISPRSPRSVKTAGPYRNNSFAQSTPITRSRHSDLDFMPGVMGAAQH